FAEKFLLIPDGSPAEIFRELWNSGGPSRLMMTHFPRQWEYQGGIITVITDIFAERVWKLSPSAVSYDLL
ncbi:hypothetical protein, partial [Escherichia sp. MOD1-EC6158]|uniref:hypothetical protein n=1 Tax=Escherichia sp. MOD1-EC6158 TaxID=2093894 RepID=UPI001F43F0C3